MNLLHVASFLAVAQAGGYREAAKLSGTPQPTLSQHIGKLERALGTTLLVRSKAGCRLTAQGRGFVPYGQALLRTAARARALFDGGSVAVGASSNVGIYLLPSYLRVYRDRRPEVRVELYIDSNPQVLERMDRYELDVAITEWWDDRDGFQAWPWRREELVFIVPPGHPWAASGSIDPDQLAGCQLIGGESGTGTGRLLRDQLGEVAATLAVSAQLGSTEAVKRSVQAGLGVSLVMAASVAGELGSGSLRAVRVRGRRLEKQLYVVSGSGYGAGGAFARYLAEAAAEAPRPA